jgi:thioredoxin 1
MPKDFVITDSKKVLIVFKSSWCSPCKVLTSIIENNPPAIPLIEIDIDEDYELAAKYKVRGVPTLIVVENGEEIKRKVGLITAVQLKQFVE